MNDAQRALSEDQKTPTALRIPVSLNERLNREADERCTSKAKLVEKALEWYLDRLPSVEAPRDWEKS